MIGVSAERTYDIFEMVEDGPLWRAAVRGRDEAIEKAKAFGHETRNEIRVIDLPEDAIVAVVNRIEGPQKLRP